MWLDDLAGILVTAGIGTLGSTLFLARAPETPHNLVALIPYGGQQRVRTHNGTERRFPRVQAVSRHQYAETALTRAEQIRAAFVAVQQQTIGSINYEVIVPLTEPIALAHDTIGRYSYIVNYEVRWHAN